MQSYETFYFVNTIAWLMGTSNDTWVVGDLICVDGWNMGSFLWNKYHLSGIEKYIEHAIQRNRKEWMNHCVLNTSQNTVFIAYNSG